MNKYYLKVCPDCDIIHRRKKKEGKMLSYKLKHMFSCVFASMAAFGLLSLGHRDAHAANVEPGKTFSFTKNAGNFSVDAVYNAKCNVGGMKGLAGTTGYYDATGLSGRAPGCTYACQEGYFVWDGNSNTLATEYTIEGPSGSGSVTATRSCFQKPTCTKGAGVVSTSVKGDVNGLYCAGTCSNGYSAAGGDDSTLVVSGPVNAAATLVCKGRHYTMTVNCGENGKYKNTDSSSGKVTVTFGGNVTAPLAEDCVWDGHDVTAYSVPDNI